MIEAYLFTSSLKEFLRFRRLIPWLILGFGGMGLALIWPNLNPNTTPVDQYSIVTSTLVFHVLALAAAIFTTAIISQEVEQRTIVYILTRPVPRWKLLFMRYLAASTVVALVGAFGAVLVSVGVYKGGFLSNELLVKDIIAMAVGAFSYCALFLLVSLLINRAMIVCLLFAFGWETIVPNMPGEMYRLSVYSHVMAIAEHPTSTGGGAGSVASGLLNTNAISAGTAYATMFVMSAILLAISAVWFTTFEYVPREDAE